MARAMTRWLLLGFLASGAFALSAACGDDDDDSTGGEGEGGEGEGGEGEGGEGEGGEGEGGEGEGGEGEGGEGEGEGGECTDEVDALSATYGEDDSTVGDLAADCTSGCALGQDEGCVVSCIKEATADAISDECLTCFELSGYCAVHNCINDCINDSGSEACITCRCENGCQDIYEECSGLPGSLDCG